MAGFASTAGQLHTCVGTTQSAVGDFLVRERAASRFVRGCAGDGAVVDALWREIGRVGEVVSSFYGGGGGKSPGKKTER